MGECLNFRSGPPRVRSAWQTSDFSMMNQDTWSRGRIRPPRNPPTLSPRSAPRMTELAGNRLPCRLDSGRSGFGPMLTPASPPPRSEAMSSGSSTATPVGRSRPGPATGAWSEPDDGRSGSSSSGGIRTDRLNNRTISPGRGRFRQADSPISRVEIAGDRHGSHHVQHLLHEAALRPEQGLRGPPARSVGLTRGGTGRPDDGETRRSIWSPGSRGSRSGSQRPRPPP